jgi:GT2 family glycosyltransferase/glycosyltransferase involved in cell wall biosynthesis
MEEHVATDAARQLIEAELEELRTNVAGLRMQLSQSEGLRDTLRRQLAERDEELLTSRRRHYIVNSYLSALKQSRVGRLGNLVRGISRLFRSRRFDQRALIAWHNLEPDSAGTWRVIGPHAHFIVPCYLPAGWLRIRLNLAGDQVGGAQFHFDTGEGNDETVLLDRIPVHGRADCDRYLYLPRPVLGVRFYPLDVKGTFRLDRLEVVALSAVATITSAIRRKFQLLRSHGLLGKSLGNAAALLFRGQFGELGRKLHGSLAYRKAPPPRGSEARITEPIDEPREHLALARGSTPVAGGRRKLDIVYVLRSAGLCGGVKVVLEHTSRLFARGHNVSVYYLDGSPDWFPWRVPARRFPNEASLRAALTAFRGIKVATWYETAPWVAESLQPGDRGYYLIQDIEDSYSESPSQAEKVFRTYSLGLTAITEGLWVRQQLRDRFGIDSAFVSIGLDHDRFRPRLVMREPQRILTQARTWSGGVSAGSRIKGWDVAREVLIQSHRLNSKTSVTTFSIEERPELPPGLLHSHHECPTDEELAELYARAGMYLLTSRHEGFGLTAAEAMACGCPVVATRAQGNEEFCIDGETALTAAADDVEQLTRHCLQLQNDPAFAHELSKQGQAFIRQYTWERVVNRLEREFLGEAAAEVVIAEPKQISVNGDTGEDTHGPLPVGAASHGTEYPDLRLRRSPFVDWTIVIPTIGKAEMVSECIASCRKFVPNGTSIEFIVVEDGGSDRGDVQALRKAAREHDFRLILNHQNLGFSASVNRGMRRARGRFVVLCNNDVVFFQPWLEPLEQAFARDPKLGIVGARLLYPNETIQHAGMDKMPGSLNWVHSHGTLPADHPAANQSRYVWAVTGALFAVRRETLERLGGFSTAYATAYEDLDYCLHAWAHGIHVGYSADVVAYHLEGHTRGATAAQKQKRPLWAERERAGQAYFERKWAFLRNVEDFGSLRALAEREPERLPVFAEVGE